MADSPASSSLAPFGHRAFAVLWTATVVSNIGTWMQNAAAGWLMTGLNPDPVTVALVQVATALPMFLFGLPAGALADVFDKRRLLILVQVLLTLVVAAFGVLVQRDQVTPTLLLLFTFVAGVAAALVAPAWQAIVPQLVPRADLAPAVALNSVGINISRALGPALAGVIIGVAGLAAPFYINALSTLGIIVALYWWRPPPAAAHPLPPERLGAAMRTGLRHARHNIHLRATLLRAAGFFLFASAYWALLPLVAREQVAGGPELYGVLVGTIGAGAVAGAFLLPALKARLGPDRLVAVGTLGTAGALGLFGIATDPPVAVAASFVAGVSWIAVLATLNVSAQVALPAWVRGRGLALFATVQYGAMSLGSYGWGEAAAVVGLPLAHYAAAAGGLVVVPLLAGWKLQTGAGVDMTPAMHWPAPVIAGEREDDVGPVLVTVSYRVTAANRAAFLALLYQLAEQRRRDGAIGWDVFSDAAEPEAVLEMFYADSWREHERQHARVTQADKALQDKLWQLHSGPTPPVVRHYLPPVT
jgi:MFS family permease